MLLVFDLSSYFINFKVREIVSRSFESASFIFHHPFIHVSNQDISNIVSSLGFCFFINCLQKFIGDEISVQSQSAFIKHKDFRMQISKLVFRGILSKNFFGGRPQTSSHVCFATCAL